MANDKSISLYSKVLFSILIHNVYTKKSKEYGIDYKHNIDVDAFSYFCALMDSLQKWGRPKQLDWAVVDLPKNHLLGNDYDIKFTEHNIIINCSTSVAGDMRNDVNALEQYLPGASHIIKLEEKEL